MVPKNLRSVVAQVARRRTSIVSRRNFSSNSNSTNESKEPGGTVIPAETTSKPRLAAFTYLVFGYIAFAAWEIIRLKEYRRTCLKVFKEEESQCGEPKLMPYW